MCSGSTLLDDLSREKNDNRGRRASRPLWLWLLFATERLSRDDEEEDGDPERLPEARVPFFLFPGRIDRGNSGFRSDGRTLLPPPPPLLLRLLWLSFSGPSSSSASINRTSTALLADS